MAGLTPFQFSSHKLQNAASISSATDPLKKNLISDTYQSLVAWYEMWINPQSLTIRSPYLQQTEHTVGAIVTHHFRKDLAVIDVKGVAGWIAIQSEMDKLQQDATEILRNPLHPVRAFKSTKSKMKSSFKQAKSSFKDEINPFNGSKSRNSGKSSTLNNSPRKFLERLRDLADEPTYYYDKEGREHYNAKFIKMYTKQYPNGIICEGFFKEFVIPESEEDVQTIPYNFTFIVQDKQPVTLIQKVAGMFTPATSLIGGGISLL